MPCSARCWAARMWPICMSTMPSGAAMPRGWIAPDRWRPYSPSWDWTARWKASGSSIRSNGSLVLPVPITTMAPQLSSWPKPLFCRFLDRFGFPAQHRLARGRGLVQPAARRQMGRAREALGLFGTRFGGQYVQHMDETVQRGLGFGLGGFDQHGAMHHQREIHGHGMIAFVDHR